MKLKPFPATLKNGTSVLVREVTQEDRHLLQIGFAHLSDRARYFRFLGAHKKLSAKELAKFTATNGPDHVAVGALLRGGTSPEPIGIARYIRLPNQNHMAEIAITIADNYQRQGLGSLFLGVLAQLARLNRINEFNAFVHGENTAMLGLLIQFGKAKTARRGEEIEIIVPVSCISAQGSQSSAKYRQLVDFHLQESEFISPDQPTSVWENEGGAIVELFTEYR